MINAPTIAATHVLRSKTLVDRIAEAERRGEEASKQRAGAHTGPAAARNAPL